MPYSLAWYRMLESAEEDVDYLSGSCTGPLPWLELQLQRRYTSMYALPDTTLSAAPELSAPSSGVDGMGVSMTGSASVTCSAPVMYQLLLSGSPCILG